MLTFQITHQQPLVSDELILLPALGTAVEADGAYQPRLVRRDARDHAGDKKHVVEDGVRLGVFGYEPSCGFYLVECGICFEGKRLFSHDASVLGPGWVEVHSNAFRSAGLSRFRFIDQADGAEHAAYSHCIKTQFHVLLEVCILPE